MSLANLKTTELFDVIRPIETGGKGRVGRPSGYKPAYAELARRMVRAGATRETLWTTFGIGHETFSQWCQRYPEFKAAIKEERWVADEQVAAALFKKATGYTRKVVKAMQHNGVPVLAEYEEQVAPDTAAAFIWLKNRQPEIWKDRHEVQMEGQVQVSLSWMGGRSVTLDAETVEINSNGQTAPHPQALELEDSTTMRVSDK